MHWNDSILQFVPEEKLSTWKIEEAAAGFAVFHNKKIEITLPNTIANLQFIAEYIQLAHTQQSQQSSKSHNVILNLAELASPLFFERPADHNLEQFLEKISTTISLKNGLDSLFGLKWFQGYGPGVLLVHQKGEARAWQIGTGHTEPGITKSIEIENFNQLLGSVKKTKTGQYSTQTTKWNWLPFSGAFLAEAFSFKNFNAILVATRLEFLPFETAEVNFFHHIAGLLGLWLEDLIEGEFSDLRLSEVMLLLERCPLPIVLRDTAEQPVFTNTVYLNSSNPTLTWFPLGRGFTIGLGAVDEWETTEIDVLHKHKVSLLGDLFNTLGHELSNPLFGLALAADLLIMSNQDPDTTVVLGEIQKNIKRCQLILQNLTRLYSDQGQEEVSDLRNAIKEALTLAKSELRGTRQETADLFSSDSPLLVEARPVLVVQILFNLIVNSAQAMGNITEAPKIAVKVTSDETNFFVDISDNGPGLPASIRESLFRPFATTKAKGHGLGLALSRNLAMKAGGSLDFLNPEEGAAFRLTLKKAP